MKKTHISFLLILLLLSLCGCGKKAETKSSADGFTVSLSGNNGTGYFWSCTLYDDSVAKLVDESTQSDGDVSGGATTTTYTFAAVRPGSTRAMLTYSRSWDSTICYTVACDINVDADKVITGELSQKSAVITLDSGEYDMTIEDDTVVRLVDSQAPSVAFQGLRDGSTTVTFTPPEGQTGTARRFLITVDQSLDISVSEAETEEAAGGVSEEEYSSLEEMETAFNFTISVPASAESVMYSKLDEMFCITFTWDGVEITYVGGSLDVSQFFGDEAVKKSINGTSVGITTYEDGCRLAGWAGEDFSGYICSAQSMTDSQLDSLLRELVL